MLFCNSNHCCQSALGVYDDCCIHRLVRRLQTTAMQSQLRQQHCGCCTGGAAPWAATTALLQAGRHPF